jgi:hypothetical protein
MSAEPATDTTLTLYNLPGDIYDHLSDFLDNKSLFVFLTLSPRRISVSNYLLQQRKKWQQKHLWQWAGEGDLKGVQHLYRLGRKYNDYELSLALSLASDTGHLAVVQFLHSIGAPCPSDAMANASANGHLAVVQFLHSIGAPCPRAMFWACCCGHLEVVQYLYSIGVGVPTTPDEVVIDRASENGHLAVVQFLHSIGAPLTTRAMDAAGWNGHLEVVQFLHGIGAPCTFRAISWACTAGHLDVVRFLLGVGAPFNSYAMDFIKKNLA